jgi:hypothetical protein
MSTPQSSPTTVTRKALSVLFRVIGLLTILLWLMTCSPDRPLLHRQLLPVGYDISVMPGTIWITDDTTFHFFTITPDRRNLTALLTLWRQGQFDAVFKQIHPIQAIDHNDILRLRRTIDEILTIHYIRTNRTPALSPAELLAVLQAQTDCRPLTNLELRFVMNWESSHGFERYPLTLLIISSHELMNRSGAIPVYPRLYAPEARAKQGLPPLPDLSTMNIFATRNDDSVYLRPLNGFVFCRRQRVQ